MTYVNANYKLVPTYPQVLVIPQAITDANIK